MTEESQRQPAHVAVRQRRGPGFPQLSLQEGIEVIKQIGKYGESHSVEALAQYMGHDTTKSGPFRQKLAAFRDWHLLLRSGDSVSLTATAMRMAHPVDPNDEAAAIREAFESCDIFMRLYKDAAKGQELQLNSLGNSAVTNLGIPAKLKEKFIKSFKESAVIAGLAEATGDDKIRLLVGESQTVSAPVSRRSDSSPIQPLRPSLAQSGRQMDGGYSPTVSQIWRTANSEVHFEIRTGSPLDAAVFQKIGEVTAKIEELVEVLRGTIDQNEDDPA